MLIAILAVNLETSDKVTGQPWHLDIFQCTSKYPRHQKSLIFHGINHFSRWFVLRCHSLERPRDGSKDQHLTQHTKGLVKNFVCFSPSDAMTDTIFIFHQTTGLNNHCTPLSHFVPLTSATFQAISPFHRPITLFSFRPENSSKCLLQSSREWKFLSNKRNSQRPN